MKPITVVSINMSYVYLGLRSIFYVAAWAILGSVTLESALTFAAGAVAIELIYYQITRYRRARRFQKAIDNLNFYKLVGNTPVPCTHEETVSQLREIAETLVKTVVTENKVALCAPYFKHLDIGSVSLTACWTGASHKDGPPTPWELVIKLSSSDEERSKSFATWEETETEFDRLNNLFKQVSTTPTLH